MNTKPSSIQASEAGLRVQDFNCGPACLNVAVEPDNGPPLLLLHGVTRCWQGNRGQATILDCSSVLVGLAWTKTRDGQMENE